MHSLSALLLVDHARIASCVVGLIAFRLPQGMGMIVIASRKRAVAKEEKKSPPSSNPHYEKKEAGSITYQPLRTGKSSVKEEVY